MKILYILQQSIYGDDGKWRTADSNIQMMRGILTQLVKKTDWKFYVLIGNLYEFGDLQYGFSEIMNHPNVKFIEYNFPVDAFMNRQNFCVEAFDNVMRKYGDFDIVWNNIVELSRNIKTYLYYKKSKAKLISCNYWMDCPEIREEKVDKLISYDWRQFDGFECSDLCAFTCQSTKDAFILNSQKRFASKHLWKILKKSTIWDFGYSSEELGGYGNYPDTYPNILFLNRLSGINYTHHEEFIKAIQILYKKRKDFHVVFANPTQKISWDYLIEEVPNLKIISDKTLTREEYKRMLWAGIISVHLFTSERYGGCSHRETLHCGNIVVTPKLYEYKIIQGEKYPFYCDNKCSPKSIAKALDKALDHKTWSLPKMWKEIDKRNKQSSFEVVSDKVVKDIKNLMSPK